MMVWSPDQILKKSAFSNAFNPDKDELTFVACHGAGVLLGALGLLEVILGKLRVLSVLRVLGCC